MNPTVALEMLIESLEHLEDEDSEDIRNNVISDLEALLTHIQDYGTPPEVTEALEQAGYELIDQGRRVK